jgi:tetratricopeptide (TPR) repeat protein
VRGLIWSGVLAFGLLFVVALPAAHADVVGDAERLIAQRRYDEAVVILEKAVASGHANADVYNELGIAYNWKQDYENALKNYRQATKLNPKYATSALPVLDHFNLYDEIIGIGEAQIAKGDKRPFILTSLLNAYYETKNTRQYQRVLDIVKGERYSDDHDANYRLFILAKAEVRAGRNDSALDYVAQMHDKSLLQFMRTAKDFQPIANDARFKKLTAE